MVSLSLICFPGNNYDGGSLEYGGFGHNTAHADLFLTFCSCFCLSVAKYGGIKRSGTDVGVTKRQSSIGNQVSGRPSVCNTDIRQCSMGQAKAFDTSYRYNYRCIAMSGAIAEYAFDNFSSCYECRDISPFGFACMDPICINARVHED